MDKRRPVKAKPGVPHMKIWVLSFSKVHCFRIKKLSRNQKRKEKERFTNWVSKLMVGLIEGCYIKHEVSYLRSWYIMSSVTL